MKYGIQYGLQHKKTNLKRIIAGGVVGLAAAGALAVPAFASSSITNGSFETGIAPGTFTTLFASDNTSIPGWTVTSGSVDYIGTYWTASNGSRSLDMSGNGAGAISQTFSTIAGHTYTVSFDMAGNPDGTPNVKTLDVASGSTPTLYSFDTTGHNTTNMGWQLMTYNFTASGPNTPLTFTSTVNTAYGPALDNVVLTDVLTNKDQCKNDGWKAYSNPSFKNKEKCMDWFEARMSDELTMSGPSQKIVFSVTNTPGHRKDEDEKNTVEYWNYDYNGGILHYSADVTCANVNPLTHEARFMFQIPVGHPGLSGLYVVAYVKEENNKLVPDLYGHAATSDLGTATQWCQTGVGFSPTMYPVTNFDTKDD